MEIAVLLKFLLWYLPYVDQIIYANFIVIFGKEIFNK